MAIRHESNFRVRRLGAGAALATVALLTTGAVDLYNDIKAGNREPACDVTAASGDTILGIRDRLDQAGDRGNGVLVLAYNDGHVRNPANPADAQRYFVNGSMALQARDTVRVINVVPEACAKVGGFVMPLSSIEASLNHRQK